MRFELGVLGLQLAHVLDGHLEPPLQVGQLLLDIGIDLRGGTLFQFLDASGKCVALGAKRNQLGGVGLARFGTAGQILLQLGDAGPQPLQVLQRQVEFLLQFVAFSLDSGAGVRPFGMLAIPRGLLFAKAIFEIQQLVSPFGLRRLDLRFDRSQLLFQFVALRLQSVAFFEPGGTGTLNSEPLGRARRVASRDAVLVAPLVGRAHRFGFQIATIGLPGGVRVFEFGRLTREFVMLRVQVALKVGQLLKQFVALRFQFLAIGGPRRGRIVALRGET